MTVALIHFCLCTISDVILSLLVHTSTTLRRVKVKLGSVQGTSHLAIYQLLLHSPTPSPLSAPSPSSPPFLLSLHSLKYDTPHPDTRPSNKPDCSNPTSAQSLTVPQSGSSSRSQAVRRPRSLLMEMCQRARVWKKRQGRKRTLAICVVVAGD